MQGEDVTPKEDVTVNLPDKPLPNVEDQRDVEFREEYQKLCQKYSRTIEVQPKYRLRDDGSYSTVLVITVKRTNK